LVERVEQKQAAVVGNLAVVTKSGQRAVSQSGNNSLEVEPVAAPDGQTADITLVISDSGHKLTTSVRVSNGAVKFLGSVHCGTRPHTTAYIFVRVSF
jgi:hypothetical protein